MASLPSLSDGIVLTHFIVAEDVERAARFYSDVLGGEIVLAGEPTIVAASGHRRRGFIAGRQPAKSVKTSLRKDLNRRGSTRERS